MTKQTSGLRPNAKPVTAQDMKRVQRNVADKNNGQTPKDSLAAKFQSIVDKR